MANCKIRFVVTEQFAGTANITEIFTDLILSEMKENLWLLEQQSGIMESPTIPSQVVPAEGS